MKPHCNRASKYMVFSFLQKWSFHSLIRGMCLDLALRTIRDHKTALEMQSRQSAVR